MRIEPLPTDSHRKGFKPGLRGRSAHASSGERVLLLTSGLGYGHVRAAQAVEAALLQRAVDVRTLDLWSLMNPGAASIVHQTYLRLVQEYPDLYERLYQLDERTWRQILESESGPPPDVLEVLELISQIAGATEAVPRGGIQYADMVTTVSPTYAREIQTADGGALVFSPLTIQSTFKVKGAKVSVPAADKALLTGGKLTTQVVHTYRDFIVLYLPGPAVGSNPGVVAADHNLVKVSPK